MEFSMTTSRRLLYIDAGINLVLGCILIIFPSSIVGLLGVPETQTAFYPSILGAVLFGIGIALVVENLKGNGLGLLGAVSINLSGGLVLGTWLLFGGLQIPLRGHLFLWSLVVLLVGISAFELIARLEKRNTANDL